MSWEAEKTLERPDLYSCAVGEWTRRQPGDAPDELNILRRRVIAEIEVKQMRSATIPAKIIPAPKYEIRTFICQLMVSKPDDSMFPIWRRTN